MNPKEMVKIIIDAEKEFNDWFETEGSKLNADKEELKSAFISAKSMDLAKISKILGDGLYASPKVDPEIPEGEALEYYVKELCTRRALKLLEDKEQEEDEETVLLFEQNEELVKKMVLQLLRSYTGKPELAFDEDDGVFGEEADARHKVFNNTIFAISGIKNGILKKEGVVQAFHGLAEFIEKEL